MVLAGGYAKRLGLIGENTAKPLLPLGEKRVIDHIIDRVEELSEVDEIIVFTNEKFKKQFEGWLKNRRHGKPIRIVAEPSRSEKEKLGAVRALAWLLEKYGIDDECLIIAGDNFFTSSLKPLVEFYLEKKRSPVVAVYELDSLQHARQFSVVELDREGRITSFLEKPEKPASKLIGTGIYMMPGGLLQLIRRYLAEKGGSLDSPGHLIQWLHRKTPVYGYILKGYWVDIGTPQTYREARQMAAANGTLNRG